MADLGFPLKKESRFFWTEGAITHPVYWDGEGPGVLILHEITGLSDECIRLAGLIRMQGYRVYLPLLFGKPGDDSFLRGNLHTLRLCIRREILCLATDESSPITGWLRSLCRKIHQDCGHRGVGVIGMCLTGGFVLATMVEPAVRAPVMCQPSLPFYQIPWPGASAAERRAALGTSPADLAAAVERSRDVPLLGYRFETDTICPRERFETLRQRFGPGFQGCEIPTGPENPGHIAPGAHSVLTRHFRNEPDHPTRKALDEILDYFRQQLSLPGREV